jgi:hypothetical protein
MLEVHWINGGTIWYSNGLPSAAVISFCHANFIWYKIDDGEPKSACIEGFITPNKGRGKPNPCTHIELNGTINVVAPMDPDAESHAPRYTEEQVTNLQGSGYYPSAVLAYIKNNKQPTWTAGVFVPFGYDISVSCANHKVSAIIEQRNCLEQQHFEILDSYKKGGYDYYRVQVTSHVYYEYYNVVLGKVTEVVDVTRKSVSEVFFDRHRENTLDLHLESGKIAYNMKHAQWILGRLFLLPSVPVGDCVCDAVKDLKALDINTVTALQGLVNCWKDIKDLIASAHGRVSLRWLDSVYLQMKYGFANTVRDAIDLSKALVRGVNSLQRKDNGQLTHASKGVTYAAHDERCGFDFTNGYEITTLTICADTLDHGLATATRTLMDLDIFPELGNVWDVIPFSFVVDWFVPFGDLFDAIDSNTYRSTLAVRYCVQSESYVFEGLNPKEWLTNLAPYWLQGDVSFEAYVRSPLSAIPAPSLQLHFPQEFTQWIPAGALVYQMLGSRR